MHIDDNEQRFLTIYSLTVEICGLWDVPPGYSKGAIARWRDIADIWRNNSKKLGCSNIFFPAIYMLHWGICPDGPWSFAQRNLFALVKEELIRDGEAYHAWKNAPDYRRAFSDVIGKSDSGNPRGPKSHSFSAYHYLYCKTFNAVVYKDLPPEPLDLVTASAHDIRAARTRAHIHAYCHGFENVIRRLLPASQKWKEKQWVDDRYILRGLKKAYNMDYWKYADDFNALMEFLMHQWYYGTTNNVRYLVNIKELSLELAEVIWPKDTKTEIEKQFLTAYSRAKAAEKRAKSSRMFGGYKGTFSFERLKASWLYKQIKEWVYNGTFTCKEHPKARKAIMELDMNINSGK